MPSEQVESVRKILNSVSKNWVFSGEIAQIGHLFGMKLVKPSSNVKFKEIHIVVPSNKLYNFQNALFNKGGYLLNTTKSSRKYSYFKHPFRKRPVILYVKKGTPKYVSYNNENVNRLVSIRGVKSGSKKIKRIQNFHNFIHNFQNNIN
jgi:hypothetical protein